MASNVSRTQGTNELSEPNGWQVWCKHERRARGKVNNKILASEWGRFSTIDKINIANAIRQVNAHATAVGNAAVEDTEQFGSTVAEIDAFKTLVACRNEYIDGLEALIRAEQRLGANEQTVNRDTADRHQQTTDRQANILHIATVRRTAEGWDKVPGVGKARIRNRMRDDSMPSEGGHWAGLHHIMTGGYGCVVLWARLNEHNRIIERVAVKDSWFDRPDQQWQWTSPMLWEGEVLEATNKTPLEVWAMQQLKGRPGSDKIVELREWRLFNDDLMYRMYMEYVPFGDCYNLMSEYVWMRKSLPEPFLWYMFENLVEACLLMETIGQNRASEDWHLVHRDLKPDNIFLGSHDDENFSAYPKPKMGDFGHVVRTSDHDEYNPEWYQNAGTEGFFAPEQVARDDPHPMRGEKLGSATNVWGVGIILAALMCPGEPIGELEYGDPDTCEPVKVSSTGYSQELIQLVRSCTRYDLHDRPTLDDVRTLIKSYTGNGQKDLADGMRVDSADRCLNDVNSLRHRGDRWAINRKWARDDNPNPEGNLVDGGEEPVELYDGEDYLDDESD